MLQVAFICLTARREIHWSTFLRILKRTLFYTMSCTVETAVQFPARSPASSAADGVVAPRTSQKRKFQVDGETQSTDGRTVNQINQHVRRKRVRLRHNSSSSSAGYNATTAIKTDLDELDKERWKRRMSAKRTASISVRDPLGLDPAFPTVAVTPVVIDQKPPFPFDRSHNGAKNRKDKIIHVPKNIDRHDPLQLNQQIQAYRARPYIGADGREYYSKREMLAERFRYGNYNRYYGYRIVDIDPRYSLMQKEWFEGKDCLDIGCNTGQFTLALTKDFVPRMMIGIDIDKQLVRTAKKNVRHYLTEDICAKEGFPKSLPILYGPIAAPAIPTAMSHEPKQFPCNLAFLEVDYVPSADTRLEGETEEFDTILALSITKWVHLNHGDDGLKRFFKRIFRHLRPGGLFLLEPQEWSSYCSGRSKGKLTKDMRDTFQRLYFRPEKFEDYLLSPDVGFTHCQKIEPQDDTLVQGFRRCLFVFFKPKAAVDA